MEYPFGTPCPAENTLRAVNKDKSPLGRRNVSSCTNTSVREISMYSNWAERKLEKDF